MIAEWTVLFGLVLVMTTVVVPEAGKVGTMGYIEVWIPVVTILFGFVLV